MIRYVGLDVHKHFIEVCVIDRKGKVLSRGRIDGRRDELQRFATQELRKTDRVALEATTNTWPVVQILRPHVAQLVLGNPLKTKAIAEAKVKTDKVDAEVLAQLLRCEYLPVVWQPDAAPQMQRSLLTHRSGLMCQRTRHKNRIQCLLNRLLIKAPCRCLWTKAGLAWLRTLELSPTDRLTSATIRIRHSCAESPFAPLIAGLRICRPVAGFRSTVSHKHDWAIRNRGAMRLTLPRLVQFDCAGSRPSDDSDLRRSYPRSEIAPMTTAMLTNPATEEADGLEPSKEIRVRLLWKIDQLQMLPSLAIKALELAKDPDCSIKQFASLIERDLTLASDMLKMANSMVYSRGIPIPSLQQAVVRLGFQQ